VEKKGTEENVEEWSGDDGWNIVDGRGDDVARDGEEVEGALARGECEACKIGCAR
jgi:hypothetical protein